MVESIVDGFHYLDKVIEMDRDFFDYPWHKNQWEELTQEYLLLCALRNGSVVGFILFHNNMDCAHLLKIYVLEQFQRLGVANLLLNSSIKRILANNIYLEVSQDNIKAVSFYEKNGFSKLVLKKNFYANGVNAWAMSKVLK